jgi:hypothetical protein
MGIWGGLLVPDMFYSGFDYSDAAVHSTYVGYLIEAFRHGSLGLDYWDFLNSFGGAPFRTYQNLPHILAAAWCWMTGTSPAVCVHFLMAMGVVFQVPAFYAVVRMLNLSEVTAFAAACLGPIVMSEPFLGNEFQSYVFQGFGLFTQSVALPIFLISIGIMARFSGWVSHSEPSGVLLGLMLALTFLLHHFLGAMALLICLVFVGSGLAFRWISFQKAFRQLAVAAVLFLILTSYQLLSIFQDAGLMHQSAFYMSRRWNGVGLSSLMEWFFRGKIFDFHRLPVFTGLVCLGIIVAFRSVSRSAKIFLVVFVLGCFYYAGRTTFGWLVDIVPGVRNVHLERFILLIHIGGTFLAALSVAYLWEPERWRVGVRIIISLALGYLTFDGVRYLRENASKIRDQVTANSHLDRSLFGSLSSDLSRGLIWAGFSRKPDGPLPKLENVVYCYIAYQMGFGQISFTTQDQTYASDATYLFDPTRKEHYSLLNVSAVLAPRDFSLPTILSPAYTDGKLISYRAPGQSRWGVIGIPTQEVVADEKEWLQHVNAWMQGENISESEYPAILPTQILRHFPGAAPQLSPSKKGPWGRVESENGFGATLVAEQPGAYAVFRNSFHPRWRITVNDERVAPQWVGPGFLAFALKPGRNVVQLEFPSDPRRVLAFQLAVVALILGLIALFLNFSTSPKFFLPHQG